MKLKKIHHKNCHGTRLSFNHILQVTDSSKMVQKTGEADALFKAFCQTDGFREILERFQEVCESLDINRDDQGSVYEKLKEGLTVHEAIELWKLLDKRAQQAVYSSGTACTRQKVWIIVFR